MSKVTNEYVTVIMIQPTHVLIVSIESQLITCWKSGHKGVLAKLCFNKDDTYVASGGTDSCVKVWNIKSHSCSYRLGGLQGVIR